MSSQTMLIVLIAVAFLIVLLALLIDEPRATEADLDPGLLEGDPELVWRRPVPYVPAPNETTTESVHPWQPIDPRLGDTNDARRPAGPPPTPDR